MVQLIQLMFLLRFRLLEAQLAITNLLELFLEVNGNLKEPLLLKIIQQLSKMTLEQ